MKNAKSKASLAALAMITTLAGAALWHQGRTPARPAGNPAAAVATQTRTLLSQSRTQGNTLPAERMQRWRAIDDTGERTQLEVAISDEITDENAADFVRALPPELLETPVGFRALERWSHLDRRAAVSWMAAQKKPTPFQISTVLRGWMRRDAAGARQYVNNLAAGPWKKTALTELTRDALQSQEPLEAIQLARQLDAGDTQTRLLAQAAQTWAQADPEAAAKWVNQVPDPALNQKLIGATALGYAANEPEAATEWLRQSLPPGEALNQAMANVVAVWVSDSRPPDAAAWVAQLPAGALRDAAVARLVREWRQLDPGAVVAWIDSLPAGSASATNSLVEQARDHLAAPLYPVRLAAP